MNRYTSENFIDQFYIDDLDVVLEAFDIDKVKNIPSDAKRGISKFKKQQDEYKRVIKHAGIDVELKEERIKRIGRELAESIHRDIKNKDYKIAIQRFDSAFKSMEDELRKLIIEEAHELPSAILLNLILLITSYLAMYLLTPLCVLVFGVTFGPWITAIITALVLTPIFDRILRVVSIKTGSIGAYSLVFNVTYFINAIASLFGMGSKSAQMALLSVSMISINNFTKWMDRRSGKEVGSNAGIVVMVVLRFIYKILKFFSEDIQVTNIKQTVKDVRG